MSELQTTEHTYGIPFTAPLPMVSPDAPSRWVHLAYEGVWKGHPDGAFKFTRGVFRTILRNARTLGNPIPVTYEHPKKDVGTPVPAAGWIHKLETRECGEHGTDLWAYVEFTGRAAAMIRDGEYRFCSVVVDPNGADPVTGEEIGPYLHELGLTNTPFIRGQHPIKMSASHNGGTKTGSHTYETKENETDMSVKQLLEKALTELAESEDNSVTLQSDGEEPADSDASAALGAVQQIAEKMEMDIPTLLKTMEEKLEDILAVLRAPAEETEDESPEQPEDSEEPAGEPNNPRMSEDEENTIAASDVPESPESNNQTEKQLAELQSELEKLKLERIENRVELAIAENKWTESDRDRLVKLGQRSPESFEEWLANPPAQRTTNVPSGTIYASSVSRNDSGRDIDPHRLQSVKDALERFHRTANGRVDDAALTEAAIKWIRDNDKKNSK